MRISCTLAALALAAAGPALAAAPPFKGANCQLATPPEGAGEGLAQGLTVKVYPRRPQIDAKYTGCQTSWVLQRNHWTVMGVSSFQKGNAVAFWVPPPEGVLCTYKNGESVGGKPGACPSHQSLAVPSMAPGCVDRILGRAGTEGCKYE
jgi:hypothetical protein